MLGRITDAEKEAHSQHIHNYLKHNFFIHKDLSAVKNSLDEVYYNVFDHAEAKGNAFSSIRYDADLKRLTVAVCDFGIGIARKVQKKCPDITSDVEAIKKAMEDKFTTQSQQHNKGMGLGEYSVNVYGK
ncbi:hypothetical protein Barb6_03361 [Bacteroidales bacterium Barb6]|nr:hypothetical protein Barb6_03361 [Bacteroidales bacterium Barb6]